MSPKPTTQVDHLESADQFDIDKKENINILVENVEDIDGLIHAETEFTPEEYKRLVWKVDLLLMPILMIAYGLQYQDLVSLAFGVMFGLPEDVGLVGNDYQNLSSFMWMGYAVAQLPMMYLLQRYSIARGLGACMIMWGGIVMMMAAANNYAGLAALRTLLGWFSSVITPGFAILTSSWYLRREQTLRQNIYYQMNYVFAIVFTAGIYFLAKRAQEQGGLAAWRVINLFLGGTTLGISVLFVIFAGTPQEVWWLTKREKLMARARIVSNSTGGGEHHPWRWEQVRSCLKDRQYWHAMAYNFLATVPLGAIMTFQQLIMGSFGFTPLQVTLYTLPGYAVILCCLVGSAVAVHYKPKLRFPLSIFFILYVVFIYLFEAFIPDETNKWAKWGVFLMVSANSIATFLTWPLMVVNVAGRTKKTFFGATCQVAFCAGQIVGTQIFIPKDAPKYKHGFVAAAIVMLVNSVNLVFWWRYYVVENRKREAAFIASGLTEEERQYANRVAGESDMTDRENPHFRYSV